MGRRTRKNNNRRPVGDIPDFWPVRTNPKGYTYYFHPKHHGGGGRTDSQWSSDITRSEEFGIFEVAVRLGLSDESGNLYNVRKDAGGSILELGTFHEQIAVLESAAIPGMARSPALAC